MQDLLEPSQAAALVLADEAAGLAKGNKQITLITHDASWGKPSTAEEALQAALKKHDVTLKTVQANLGNPMLSGQVGLKAADFIQALDQSGSGAVISLVGAPLLTDGDIARVKSGHPPVLVMATASLGDKMGVRTDPLQLARLLDAKIINLAIIDGGEASAVVAGKPDPKRELFAQHYRILRPPD